MFEKFITFGIGGCGCTIAHRMAQKSTMQAICIDTDASALENKAEVCSTLLIGEDRFDGNGTGGSYESACLTAKEIQPLLREKLKDCSLAIVVTGVGGGTGSAITPALLQAAHDMSIPTMVFIVLPFAMEGDEKTRIAARAISNITNHADIYCCFKNDELCSSNMSTASYSFYESIENSTAYIISGITMLWRMITQQGYINLDKATLLECTKKGHGQFFLCNSIAYGEGRTQKAINELISSPNGIKTHSNNTACALVGVFGGLDLRLSEISETVTSLTVSLSDNTPIKLGTVVDPSANGSLELVSILFERWVEEYEEAYTSPAPITQQPTSSSQTRPAITHTIGTFTPTHGSQTGLPPSHQTIKFSNTDSFIYNGENLDQPTYIRKRISIS